LICSVFEGINENITKQVFLICNVLTEGNYAKVKDSGKSRPDEVLQMTFRQAVGVATQDITNNLKTA
jgi:hypothetical protein